ncbi:MAG: hypothetical protein LAT57_03925 [Balneolales bacterium]|nr:hypothetical protein [Balneolales bacterium]
MLARLPVKILLTSALIVVFGLFNQTSAQAENPRGTLQTASPDEIWPHTMSGSHFNEFWNYQFYLEDDIKVHIIFSVNNFGSLKSPVSGVRITVHGLSDKTYNLSREYNLDWLVLDKEKFTFRPREERDLYFTGRLPEKHRVFINTSKDGVNYEIDFNFSNIQPGLVWGDGIFRLGNEDVGIITHIPYAEVTGRIKVDGHERQVRGTAYMDQTYQNQMTTRLLHSAYRFVHHGGPQNWDISYFMLPSDRGERRTIGYRISRFGDETKLNGINRIQEKTRSRAFGKQIAQNLSVELDNGQTMSINRSHDDESFSVMGDLGWLARRAARTLLGGEVIDFRGQAYCRVENEMPKMGEYNYFIIE